jgi:hypothetical protein
VPEDDEISVKLSLRTWRIVTAHVEGGIYRDVQPILALIYAQVNSQITAANDRAAQAVRDEIRAIEAARMSNQPEGAGEDASEPTLISQPTALH